VDEGIDELAEFCGAGKAVAEWTARLNFSNGNSFLEKGLCFFEYLWYFLFMIFDF
jgi:hypothetical protein